MWLLLWFACVFYFMPPTVPMRMRVAHVCQGPHWVGLATGHCHILASGCSAQGPFGSTVPFSAHPWLLEFLDSRRFVLWSRLWSTRMTSSWRASWWSNPSTSRSGDSVGSCWLRSISAASRLRATTPIPRSMCAWRSAQRSEVPKTAQGRRTPSVCRRHNVLSAWLHETRQRRNNGSAGLGGRWFEGLCSLMRIMSELPRRRSIQVFERKGPSYGSQFSSSVLVTLLRFDPVSDPSSGRPPLKFLCCLEVALPRGSWTFLFCRHIVPTIITWMAGKKNMRKTKQQNPSTATYPPQRCCFSSAQAQLWADAQDWCLANSGCLATQLAVIVWIGNDWYMLILPSPNMKCPPL